MTEKKLEVFNVLNFLDKGYELDYILKEGNFGTFSSADECVDYLIENGYLSKGDNSAAFEIISKKHTVAQLKDILRENNLKVSGKKHELVERAMPILSKKIDREFVLLMDDEPEEIKLTDKGKEFLKENEWIDLYMFALVAFRFSDYELFYENSSEDSFHTALNFCDEVLSRALISNQFIVFIDALSAKAHVYAYAQDYESFLDYDLQRFILGLNPFNMDSKTYSTYEIISSANIINLKNVIDHFDFGNLKKRFNKIWKKSNISNITVPKNISYKILMKALSGEDIEVLNFDLRERYFNEKFLGDGYE